MTVPNYFTPGRCITLAMEDAGLLQEGDLPTSEQLAKNMGRLVDLILLWQTQGLKLWLQQDLPITLSAGNPLYTLGPGGTTDMPKPMRVLQAYTLNTAGISRPLMILSWDEWTRLSNRIQQGAINSVFVDKQQTLLNVNLWQVPDTTAATDILHLIIQNQVTVFTGLNDTMNFPSEWFMALRWGLADEICTGQPEEIVKRCQLRADTFRKALEDWDVEDASTVFQPDYQAGNYQRGFY